MRRLAQYAVSRPRAALGAWVLMVAVLALVGRGVDARLQPTDLGVDGSSSAKAATLVDSEFGASATIPVLLTGPSRDVRSQGKRLAKRLQGEAGVTVVSPWNAGPRRAALRPAADRLMLLASVRGRKADIEAGARRVRDIARGGVRDPVRAQVTGVPLAAFLVALREQRLRCVL